MNFYCQYTKLIFLYFWQRAKILETNNASSFFFRNYLHPFPPNY